jgi:Holliday junction resolvase RusA-like endonuclease
MAPLLAFFVPGLPIAQNRTKQGVNAAGGAYRYVEHQKPIHAWRAMIAMEGRRALGDRPLLTCAVELRILLVFPRPPSRRDLQLSRDDVVYHRGKPDNKNVLTGIEDSLNQVVWVDDSQNAIIYIAKIYTRGDEKPGTHIEIREAKAPQGVKRWTSQN